jgi:hypothetical protein
MKNHKLSNDQRGMVSIMVTLVMMIVVSLLVLNFARIARREQREALDRQLNTQAFYAAEAGINDAARAISNGYGDKTVCGTITGDPYFGAGTNQVGTDPRITYSCLLIDRAPANLEYTNIDHESKVIPLNSYTSGGAPTALASLRLTWKDKNGAAANLGCTSPQLPPASAWGCSVGILRADLISVPSGVTLNRNTLNSSMYSVFLYPTNGGGTGAVTLGTNTSQGAIGNAICTGNPLTCTYTITGTNSGFPIPYSNSANFYLRVRTIYRAVSLNVEGFDSSGNQVDFKGAQVTVDATGKANDILRRIQVRLPSGGISAQNLPEYVLQTRDSICKRYIVIPPSTITTDIGTPSLDFINSATDICAARLVP